MVGYNERCNILIRFYKYINYYSNNTVDIYEQKVYLGGNSNLVLNHVK